MAVSTSQLNSSEKHDIYKMIWVRQVRQAADAADAKLCHPYLKFSDVSDSSWSWNDGWESSAEFPWSNPAGMQAAAIQLKNQLRRWCRIGTMQTIQVWKVIDPSDSPSDSGVLCWVWLGLTWISIVFHRQKCVTAASPLPGAMGHHCTGGLEGEPGYTERDTKPAPEWIKPKFPNSNTLTPQKDAEKWKSRYSLWVWLT